MGGVVPFWGDLGRLRSMRRALQGINAAVVGILLAALFQPLWQVAIRDVADFCLALVAFLLLMGWKQPAWRVVIGCALVGAAVLPG
jgi:chromate transporter